MIGKIRIEDYKIHCIIGVKPHERNADQELALDIEVEVDFTQCVLSDEITDTVNYEKIGAVCKDLAQSRKYHLVETFVYEALNALFDEIPLIRAAKIRAKKKAALPLAAYTSIEMERKE